MGSTREQVGTYVLSKCLALYECPHSKTDPAYEEMVKIYMDQLRPFDPWELQEGMSVLIQRRKVRKWPTVGEISEACGEVRRDRLPPNERDKPRLEGPKKPPRKEITPEERRLVSMKGTVRREWESSGKYLAKNPDGSWKYTVADLNAEAQRRLQARHPGEAA